MARKDVEHNAAEILRYLEVLLPKLEPSGGIPENPMNRKERGTSRPPVLVGIVGWLVSHDAAAAMITAIGAAIMAGDVSGEGR